MSVTQNSWSGAAWSRAARSAGVGAGAGLVVAVLLDVVLAATLRLPPAPDPELALIWLALPAVGGWIALMPAVLRSDLHALELDTATFRMLQRVVLGGRAEAVPEAVQPAADRFAAEQSAALPAQAVQQLLMFLALTALLVSALQAPRDELGVAGLGVVLLIAFVCVAVVAAAIQTRRLRNLRAYLTAHPPGSSSDAPR